MKKTKATFSRHFLAAKLSRKFSKAKQREQKDMIIYYFLERLANL